MNFAEWDFGFMVYGEKWRTQRRIFHSHAHQGVAPQYQGIQLRETRAYLQRLLADPENFATLTRR